MTRKEELLEFISAMDGKHWIRTAEHIVDGGQLGNSTYKMYNDVLAQFITNNFDDDLVGTLPNDNTPFKILDWSLIDRAEEFYK